MARVGLCLLISGSIIAHAREPASTDQITKVISSAPREAPIPLSAEPTTKNARLPPAEIPCSEEQTDLNYETIELKESTRLQPKDLSGKACSYRTHFVIKKSGVAFDCQGARLLGSLRDEQNSFDKITLPAPATEEDVITDAKLRRPVKPLYGILLSGAELPAGLSNVTVRNCVVEGFERNFGIENPESPAGANLVIEDSKSIASRAYGVFVGPNVSALTMRKLDVADSRATGIFFSPGASGNTLTLSRIVGNGKANFMPHQDGVTLDSAPKNKIIANLFEKNGMAGLSLFHNCGEYGQKRPATQADENVIRANHFKNENVGAWIGSRQSMNQQPLGCSVQKTFDDSNWDIVEDFAKQNVLENNTFTENQIGLRIEDDQNRAVQNTFKSSLKQSIAILIGHRFGRPRDLRRPIEKTLLTKNSAQVTAKNAYQYCFLQTATEMSGNTSNKTETQKLTLAEHGCGIHEGPMDPPRLPAQNEEN